MPSLRVDAPGSSHLLVLRTGDEVIAELTAFALREGITAAHFTGIGAWSDAVLGHFDPLTRVYGEIAIEEQVEVIALLGNMSLHEGAPRVHAHALVGFPDGTTRGGHLIRARVCPTLEVFVTRLPVTLTRRIDGETGLALIDLG